MDGRLIIANQRIETRAKFESSNPATLESLGEFSLASETECNQAVQAAKSAFPVWKDTPTQEKKKILRRAKNILFDRSQTVAETISREKGTPITESLSTILGALEALEYYAHNAQGSIRPHKAKHHVFLFTHKKGSFRFQPLGPTLIISPWNYPFIIPLLDTLSALVAGNTVILRPSTTTPFTALNIGEIFIEAGLPPGVLNIVNCRSQDAESMLTSPEVQTIMFTGSTGVGKKIMSMASRNLTNLTLELGGKDPMIVCADTDLEKAALGAVWGAFTNTGQSCGSVERLYVQDSVAEEFIQRVLEHTKKLKVGDPLDPETDIGPMTTLSQLNTVEGHLEDARQKGARILWGGERISEYPGYFLRPAVLSHTNHSMQIMTEETFGPALPIMTFSSLEQAVALANDSDYGLTASVWTQDREVAAEMIDKIEAGTVTVNDHMTSFVEPGAIWGGIKQTGIGRSHGPYGLLGLVNIKFTALDFAGKSSYLWWYPYSRPNNHLFRQAITLYHHPKLKHRIGALLGLVPQLGGILKKMPFTNLLKSLPRLFK